MKTAQELRATSEYVELIDAMDSAIDKDQAFYGKLLFLLREPELDALALGEHLVKAVNAFWEAVEKKQEQEIQFPQPITRKVSVLSELDDFVFVRKQAGG